MIDADLLARSGPLRSVAFAAALLLGCSGGTADTDRRPDLLLLTVDTLRADALECYGGPADAGRSLCALGETGTRFEWAFATVPYTAPSVASLLTSRYPSDHGVSQFSSEPADESLETLAEVLRAAGYRTAAVVSNPVVSADRNLDQGFERYDDEMDRVERNREGYVERAAAATTDAALAWLATVDDGPWFLWVHYQDPHGPYDPPGSALPVDATAQGALPKSRTQAGYRSIPRYQVLGSARAFATYQRRYLDEVRYLDDEVARLLSTLDSDRDAPGVLFTADHGEALGEDEYFFSHGHSVALDQIRVPMIWRPPGGSDAHVVATPTSLIDAAPTLLAAAGVAVPEAFAGRDLGAAIGERVLYAEHPARRAIVAGDRYYARDLDDLSVRKRDPNTGGRLNPLPARSARLGSEPQAGYRYEVGEQPDLEDLLRSRDGDRAFPTSGELDAATRERLRALGYIE